MLGDMEYVQVRAVFSHYCNQYLTEVSTSCVPARRSNVLSVHAVYGSHSDPTEEDLFPLSDTGPW